MRPELFGQPRPPASAVDQDVKIGAETRKLAPPVFKERSRRDDEVRPVPGLHFFKD